MTAIEGEADAAAEIADSAELDPLQTSQSGETMA
jgi:hypothetical protein